MVGTDAVPGAGDAGTGDVPVLGNGLPVGLPPGSVPEPPLPGAFVLQPLASSTALTSTATSDERTILEFTAIVVIRPVIVALIAKYQVCRQSDYRRRPAPRLR